MLNSYEGKWGCARDLCVYLRNYWGSIVLNEYAFGGPWPHADFIFQNHICCSHATWLQTADEIDGGKIPYFCFDVGAGPYDKIGERQIRYVADQLHDGIAFLEKVTKRKIDDKKLARKVENTYRSCCYWAKTCELNKSVPAPLDEKTMFSLYGLGTLEKSKEQGITIKNRDHALCLLAEGELKGKLMWAPFYGASYKVDLVNKIAKQWKVDAGVIHLNRGCEGSAQHQMEMKNALAKMSLPVMTFEGNMADEREFDEARTARMIDLFVTETLGLKKVA